ncbi:hypothetical protein [Psychrobacter sp. van23A]|uniref:hypothetical protein n=1 Tax=Psychrobacter sp. van23A TaxID=3064892 RepID=UPI0027BAADD7|nr:hypothetical protein [Psychrobacter sp. van23A]WLW65937.1 hypothetical protein RAH45_10970 [Psychrobacter sp. van23A]
MSQIFNLCLATDTLAADAEQLGVTIGDLKSIQIEVVATLVNRAVIAQPTEWQLQLDYCITLPLKSLAAQLYWPTWQAEQVGFADYLWEQTCLECFLAGKLINSAVSINENNNKTNPYMEINASPDGRYALYQFADYRKPATLPPTPLLQGNGQTRASINWTAPPFSVSNAADNAALQSGSMPTSSFNGPLIAGAKTYHFERSFYLSLNQLSQIQTTNDEIGIEYIHPCVILSFDTKFGKTALYFAPNHAAPPDFHDTQYWSVFDEKVAMHKPHSIL